MLTPQQKQLAALGAACDFITLPADRRLTLVELYDANCKVTDREKQQYAEAMKDWGAYDTRDQIRADYESERAAEVREERE